MSYAVNCKYTFDKNYQKMYEDSCKELNKCKEIIKELNDENIRLCRVKAVDDLKTEIITLKEENKKLKDNNKEKEKLKKTVLQLRSQIEHLQACLDLEKDEE